MSPDQSSKSIHLAPGTVIHGHDYEYVIEKTLGQGSFGITYLASVKLKGALGELSTKAQVAIKEFCMQGMLSRDGSTLLFGSQYEIASAYLDKFRREAINLSHLHHPGIVRTLESIEENGTAYYVMEFIDGTSLGSFVDSRGRLTEEECLTLVRPIAEALGYMHSQSMLHLDVKPGNIMLRRDGRPVLIDFGLSKTFDADGTIDTKTMIGNGTLGYAPIEQSDYSGTAFGAMLPVTMDIYAIGATMYKMLTGRRPPEASTVLNEGLPDKELALCGQLAEVVEKAMNPIIKRRYRSIAELLAALPSTAAAKISPGNSVDTEMAHESEPTPVIKSKEVVKEAEPTVPLIIRNGLFAWDYLKISLQKSVTQAPFSMELSTKSRLRIADTVFQFKLKEGIIPEDVRRFVAQNPVMTQNVEVKDAEHTGWWMPASVEIAPSETLKTKGRCYDFSKQIPSREVNVRREQAREAIGRCFSDTSIANIVRKIWTKASSERKITVHENDTAWVSIMVQSVKYSLNSIANRYISIYPDRIEKYDSLAGINKETTKISKLDFQLFLRHLAEMPYMVSTIDFPDICNETINVNRISIKLFGDDKKEYETLERDETIKLPNTTYFAGLNGGNLKVTVKEMTDFIDSILPQEKKSFWGKIF